MMNNSYANSVYSGHIGEDSELQNEQQQFTGEQSIDNYQEEQSDSVFDGLKENHCQGRETIIANNKSAQEKPEVMEEQNEEVKTDGEMETEVLEENHQPEEEGEAVDETVEKLEEKEELDESTLQDEEKIDGDEVKEEEKTDIKTDEDDKDKESEDKKEQLEEEHLDSKEGTSAQPKPEGVEKVKVRRVDGQPADLDMCRVCMSKDELNDIFDIYDSNVRICDLIMKICVQVRISSRDHLPHKICKNCIEKAKIANEFKLTCENTDKELRRTLKRCYTKSRRTTDFVIVNCPMSDEEENDEDQPDDDEYKVSQSEVESEPPTSDDSFEPANKRRRTRTPKRRGRKPKSETSSIVTPGSEPRRRGRKPGTKMGPRTPRPEVSHTPARRGRPGRPPGRPPRSEKNTPGIANVVYIEAPDPSTSDSDDDKPIRPRKTHCCTKCDDTFATGVELKEHLQTHKGDLFPCTKCEKSFKSKVYLANHLERHDQDDKRREEKVKAKEMKKQQQRQKEIQKRREQEERVKQKSVASASSSAEKKKKPEPSPASSGRDLFKCVAPLTSTYWSDSFSD